MVGLTDNWHEWFPLNDDVPTTAGASDLNQSLAKKLLQFKDKTGSSVGCPTWDKLSNEILNRVAAGETIREVSDLVKKVLSHTLKCETDHCRHACSTLKDFNIDKDDLL